MDKKETNSEENEWDTIIKKAFGTFRISEKGRYILFIILIIINVTQIALGIVLIIIGYNGRQIGHKLETSLKMQFERIFSSLILFGISVVIIHLAGIKICINCAYPVLNYKPGYVLRTWLLVGFINAILGLAICSLSPNIKKNILQQMKNSLLQGMTQYLNDPLWKKMFDHLQSEMECCGTLSYSDWYSISWINVDYLRHDSRTVQHYSAVDGRVLPPVVPWSCCNPHVPFHCLHDTLQQKTSDSTWKDILKSTVDSIYTVGCLEILKPTIQTGFNLTIGITITNFLFMIVTIVLARYLYTSSCNSIIFGDPSGYSYGWLIGPGDFGIKTETEEQPKKVAKQNKQEELVKVKTEAKKNQEPQEETSLSQEDIKETTSLLDLNRKISDLKE